MDVDGTEVDSYVYAELLVVGGGGGGGGVLIRNKTYVIPPTPTRDASKLLIIYFDFFVFTLNLNTKR